MYLRNGDLKAELLNRGFKWFDTGTNDSLLAANNFVQFEQNELDTIIACLEQIGYQNGWLDKDALLARADLLRKNNYGAYLKRLAEEEKTFKIRK